MRLSLVQSRALVGLQSPAVTVEVHLANGLPSFSLVGLADTEVKEARERVRCAITHAGLPFPANRRITVNLAPADLPKEGSHYDLPIALGLMTAMGIFPPDQLAGHVALGELALDGRLRAVPGVLPAAVARARSAATRP